MPCRAVTNDCVKSRASFLHNSIIVVYSSGLAILFQVLIIGSCVCVFM